VHLDRAASLVDRVIAKLNSAKLPTLPIVVRAALQISRASAGWEEIAGVLGLGEKVPLAS
jgi:hypothetical protein